MNLDIWKKCAWALCHNAQCALIRCYSGPTCFFGSWKFISRV